MTLGRRIISGGTRWGTHFKINGEWSYIPLYWEWLEDDLYKTLKKKIASKIKTILKMKTILRTKTCLEDEDNLEEEDCLGDEDCRCKALKIKTILKMKTILRTKTCLEDEDNLEDGVCPCKDVHWYLCNGATVDATI